MQTIDELIAAAQKAYDDAPNEEKSEKRGALEALKRAKGEGLFTQGDVNSIVKREKDSYERDFRDVLGMDLKEAKEVFEQMDDDTLAALSDAFSGDSSEDADDGDDDENPRLQKVVGAVKKLQADRDGLSETLTDLNRRYAKDKVDVAIKEALRGANLHKEYLDGEKYDELVRPVARYDDLVERVTRGEQLTQEDIAGKVERVKELSGVWFKEGDGDDGEDGATVAGHKITVGNDAVVVRPHIPATPNSNGATAEITEEDRAARASSVY